jgi:hypothetical protein
VAAPSPFDLDTIAIAIIQVAAAASHERVVGAVIVAACPTF